MGVTAAVAGTVAAVNSVSGGAITNAITGGGGGGGGGSTGSYSSSPGGSTSTTYDPFGPYRGAAATDLSNLMANPALAMAQPGYQQQLKQGMQTAQRGAAATGQLASGQEAAALNTLGQNTFASYYNAQLANLMQMSGASQSPAAAGQAQTQANLAAQGIRSAQTAQMSSGLGQLAGAANQLGGYFGGGSGTNINNTSYFGGSGGGWVAQGDTASTASLFGDSSAYSSSAGWSM